MAWATGALAILLLLLALVALPSFTIRHVEIRIDAITGTTSTQTVWLFGFRTAPHVHVSPIEARLKSRGIPWTPSWQVLSITGSNVLGNATSHACGIAPPIHQLHALQQAYVDASSEADLRDFVHVLQSGTDTEKKDAVAAACDKAITSTFLPP